MQVFACIGVWVQGPARFHPSVSLKIKLWFYRTADGILLDCAAALPAKARLSVCQFPNDMFYQIHYSIQEKKNQALNQ